MLAALYDGPFKIGMHIISYLGMGWAGVLCASEIYQRFDRPAKAFYVAPSASIAESITTSDVCSRCIRMSPEPMGLFHLLIGGLLYTGGVPFNVRDKRVLGIPDHTIWHLFVMGGSIMHYFCIYSYILPFPYPSSTLT